MKWAQFSIKFCRNILFLYFTLTPLNTFIILVLVLYFNVNFYVKMCFWRSKWKKWKTDFFWKLTFWIIFKRSFWAMVTVRCMIFFIKCNRQDILRAWRVLVWWRGIIFTVYTLLLRNPYCSIAKEKIFLR